MIRLVAIAVLLHTAFARADVVLHDDDDVPPLRGNYPTVPPPPPPPADPLELPRLRVDGGLGVARRRWPNGVRDARPRRRFAPGSSTGQTAMRGTRRCDSPPDSRSASTSGASTSTTPRRRSRSSTSRWCAATTTATTRSRSPCSARIEPRFLAGELQNHWCATRRRHHVARVRRPVRRQRLSRGRQERLRARAFVPRSHRRAGARGDQRAQLRARDRHRGPTARTSTHSCSASVCKLRR